MKGAPDISDGQTAAGEKATAQHQLEARNRGRKIDLPELLVSGVSIWVFPMEPWERLPVHDHKFNVGSIAITPVKELIFAVREHGSGNYSLELTSNTFRQAGSSNALNPTGTNIHTIINDSDEPASTIHIVGFSPQNGIQHPVRNVYTGEKAPPGANIRVGSWSVSGESQTELGTWEIRTSLKSLIERPQNYSIGPGGERI